MYTAGPMKNQAMGRTTVTGELKIKGTLNSTSTEDAKKAYLLGKNPKPVVRLKKSFQSSKPGQDGFTLIELLIVLVILGLLAALVGPTLVEHLKPAKRTVAAAQIEEFSAALDNFYMDMGRYPSAEEGMQALMEKPPGAKNWKGPYLKKEIPSDPWGNPFVYRFPGQHGPYDILSCGPDGKEGVEGNVTSWESEKK